LLSFCVLNELPHNGFKLRMKIDEPKETDHTESTDNKLLYPKSYYSNLLSVYFRLHVDLETLYATWLKAHGHFRTATDQFYAVRMLDQDPVENLISFICSQNNHISRITSMVEKICSLYGDAMGNSYFSFPNLEKLAQDGVEAKLRQEGFGYRAKYIQTAAQQIVEKGGMTWFEELQVMSYKDAHKQLLSLVGVGPKVADCICLMSLNHLEAVPVDTHVFQIAKNYIPSLKNTKSLSSKMYDEVADTFRKVYGQHAGWAQTVLFCAELKIFKNKEENDSINTKTDSKSKKQKLK